MNLYNTRNKIIKLFENNTMYAFDTKSNGVEESGQKFDKIIGERVKLRRQKADDKTDEADDDDKKRDTKNMPKLEGE